MPIETQVKKGEERKKEKKDNPCQQRERSMACAVGIMTRALRAYRHIRVGVETVDGPAESSEREENLRGWASESAHHQGQLREEQEN
jgi:hypothetical protein